MKKRALFLTMLLGAGKICSAGPDVRSQFTLTEVHLIGIGFDLTGIDVPVDEPGPFPGSNFRDEAAPDLLPTDSFVRFRLVPSDPHAPSVAQISAKLDMDIDLPQASYEADVVAGNGYGTYTFGPIPATVPEGGHVVTVTASNVLRQAGFFSTLSLVDRTPPTCEYIFPPTPTDRTWVNGQISLQIRSADAGVGVRGVSLLNPANTGILLPYLPLVSPNWQYPSYDTRVLTDGSYPVVSACSDRAGNVRQIQTVVRVDNTAPSATFNVSPAPLSRNNKQLVHGMEDLVTTVDDGQGIGVGAAVINVDGNTLAGTILNTAAYADGLHRVSFEAADLLGNKKSINLDLTFDNSPPVVTITSMDNSVPTIVGSLNSVAFNAQEANGLLAPRIFIDEVEQRFTRFGSFYTFPPVTVNGIHTLEVQIADTLGNVGKSKRRFLLVNGNGPQLPGVNGVKIIAPQNNAFVDGASLQLKGVSPVSGGVGSFSVNGNPVAQAVLMNGYGVFSKTISIGDEGPAVIGAALRRDTEEYSDSISLVVDNTAPTVDFVAPAPNENMSGTVHIQGNAQDTSLATLELFDGTTLLAATNATGSTVCSIHFLWDTTQTSVGTHALTFIAIDQAGHSSSLTRTVTVQSSPNAPLPEVSFISPGDGDAVSGIVTLLMKVEGAAALAGFTVDDGPFLQANAVGSDAYSYMLVTPQNYADGFHRIKALATNASGTVFKTIQINIDNTAPTLTVTNPTAGKNLFFTQNLIANASDNSNLPLSSVKFSIDSETVALFPGNTDVQNKLYSYLFDTTAYAKGNHQLLVVAFDKAGNSSQAIVPFIVDNDNPPISSASVAWTPSQGSFDVGPAETQITATITNAFLDLTLLNDDALKVYATKDGQKTRVLGTVSLTGNKLRFGGTVPYNAEMQCVLGAIDTNGKLIRETLNFISGIDKNLGGQVKYLPDNFLTITIPPGALAKNAFVKVVMLEAGQAPPTAADDGLLTAYGPFNLLAWDDAGAPIDVLGIAGRLDFSRLTAQIPPAEQSFVDRAEQYVSGTWKAIGSTGGSPTGSSGSPTNRALSVPVTKFGYYRITSAPVPGDGITDLYNYPNPFAPADGGTDFNFLLNQTADVEIVIYDLFGNLVIRMDRTGFYGQNTIHWDGRNGKGDEVANGGYVAQFTVKDSSGKATRARRKLAVAK